MELTMGDEDQANPPTVHHLIAAPLTVGAKPETLLAKEVAAEVVKALQQPRRKRAPNPTTKKARARSLAEELYPNGVGVGDKQQQKKIRSEFCATYETRFGEKLSDSQAWKALFGSRG
jgi:hypothetical protein